MPARTARLASLVGALALALAPATSLAQSTVPSAAPVTITGADGTPVEIDDASRVVTLGGVVTEIAYALGAADQVAAVDASSLYPPEALKEKPIVGYYRAISAEPILAASPTLVLGTDETGPADAVEAIRAAGVPVLLLPLETSVEGTRTLITSVGEALGRTDEAQALVASFDADLTAAAALLEEATSSPRVLFILQPPGAPVLVSGTGTAADAMIALAGATNAVTDYASYVPLSPEAVAAAAPDVILTTDDSLEALGGVAGVLAQPGLGQTPAAQNGRVVSLEELYLLGFGPRLGHAVGDLVKLLHPEIAGAGAASGVPASAPASAAAG